jgi:dihydroorotate dehydrogenase
MPIRRPYNLGPDAYLEHVRRAKEAVGIPIIGSLNGVSTGEWIEFAKKIEQAGADALELNVYYVPTDPALTSADLAVTGGVHTSQDVLKSMMAGAQVAMMTSALLKHGIDVLRVVRVNLVAWMEAHEYASIQQMQGSMSYRSVAEPAAFERANYMKVLSSYALRTAVPPRRTSWPRVNRGTR